MTQKIKTFNAIAEKGLNILQEKKFEVSDGLSDPDAIILRSHKLKKEDFGNNLKAIARAGAGVNNIPVEECSELGIPVFNTPGANANAVKEIVLAALLMSSRGLFQGANFVNSIEESNQEELKPLIESGKKSFKGRELTGGTLGVVGMGAIGSKVADMGVMLGMNVIGYDPAITVEAAWKLPNKVERKESIEDVFKESDYISLHVPANDKTKGLINSDLLKNAKKGLRLINFARDEIVVSKDIIESLDKNILSKYITDFADLDLISRAKIANDVIILPHIGASTSQAEENCSVMAAEQLDDFLNNGNIKNSVNFPELIEPRPSEFRITLSNKNHPGMIGKITTVLADNKLNIIDMVNKSRGDIAYNVIDLETKPPEKVLVELSALDDVISVREV
ncbi:MAG: D-3-phosphoglycerate dehydrogenase [Gammaproteobacteria bacterium]|nr:MAG: D-3-phosphoglycerate dehydrogenase [Gammaproteobacteria bacterium]|tara:strand:+ start:900 stop:2081 length:1182 start_codon:yes stop_codon:yes gene_type:complete